jgi:subtilisin family serine protease
VGGPLDGLIDPVSGHGTFIAGLVRQMCPDADILAIRVVHGDGLIVESELVEALEDIEELVRRGADGDLENGRVIDVLNMSMGYYHEDADDVLFDSPLLATLQSLGKAGTVVVTSAGNDATSRKMYPAAFSPHEGGNVAEPARDTVPVISVGALNLNETAALFSNAGEWVSCWARGASLVSTIPAFDGGAQPVARTPQPASVRKNAPDIREALDPDNFAGQFAVWSGTSFAAPLVAGRVAASLLEQSLAGHPLMGATGSDPVSLAWTAIEPLTGWTRPAD